MINYRPDTIANSKNRARFFAQQHSSEMVSFLQSYFDEEHDYITEEEQQNCENLIHLALKFIDRQEFPEEQLIALTSFVETTPIISQIISQNFRFLSSISEIIPHVDQNQKSVIFNHFDKLIMISNEITQNLVDMFHFLIHACQILVAEDILDKTKLVVMKCLHHYAVQSNDNVLNLFKNIAITYKGQSKKTTPIQCMIQLNTMQKPDESDEVMKFIKVENVSEFGADHETSELRHLILKFFVALLNTKNIPIYSQIYEIINIVVYQTFDNNEEFVELAMYGCAIVSNNTNLYPIFLSVFKNKCCVPNFINLLANSKNHFVRQCVLLCFKSIIEMNAKESDLFINVHIINHIKQHLTPAEEVDVIVSAINFLGLLIKSNDQIIDEIFNERFIHILYDYLADSPFLIKEATLQAFYVFINKLDNSRLLEFDAEFPEIIERVCLILNCSITEDEIMHVFNIALKIADLYIANGKHEHLYNIIMQNEINELIDSFLTSDSILVNTTANQLKKKIIPKEGDSDDDMTASDIYENS